MGVSDYSTTPGSNSTINGINIAESCDPGNINDALRQGYADFATFLQWSKHTAAVNLTAYDTIQADTVTTGAFTATLPASPSAGHWCAILAASTWATNNLTIARNGSTIRGAASDLTLSDAIGAAYFFHYDGATWQYFNIGDVDLSSYLQLAGGTMTGDLVMSSAQIQGAKGADVTSATALTLGTDGNFFDVTGTTTITSINTVKVGTTVILQFDAVLTLTHHATDLILPGGANITTAAGDIAVFTEYASGDWKCDVYTKADGSALVVTEAQVKAALDGANITSVTPADDDEILLLDTSDSGNLKTATKSDLASSDVVKISQQTISSDSSIDFTWTNDGTYKEYFFVLAHVVPANDGVNLYFRLSSDGGSTFDSGSVYRWAASGRSEAGAVSGNSSSDTAIYLNTNSIGSSAGEGYSGRVWLTNPAQQTIQQLVEYTASYTNSSGQCTHNQGSGRHTKSGTYTTQFDGARFLFASGNLESGTITMYGVK
jgi:hypothetical protein